MRHVNDRWRPRVHRSRPQYVAAAALAALLAGVTATPGMAHDADRTVNQTDATTQGKVAEKSRFARQ
ncbi:hypothetical protein, partial [Streptomyces sp. NPDC002133]|uniref:hypothetical protein n=1 Tax=Streptomyces sp. NPDC002133 TaxID=3154409 RepID=UPI00332B605A